MVKSAKFDRMALQAFSPAEKIGLLATLNEAGLPHITLITSIMAKDEETLMLGQFSVGLSKRHVLSNSKTGFLVMTLKRQLWRGTALWEGSVTSGKDYIRYNELPMFRYNTYFGINTVHYFNLCATTLAESLPLGKIACASLLGLLAAGRAKEEGEGLKPFAMSLFNSLRSLKFVAYINAEGFPLIIPLIQLRAAAPNRLIFSPCAYAEEIAEIPPGAVVAVFCLTMGMESVLVRGVISDSKRRCGVRLREIAVNWVYNSMPPCHGQIYPPVPLVPVREF
ncbi:MAG: hypothetical protein K9K75_00155 [Deltaproteobacteria bacterium]|nr:hypothetical protein [Deltaproteobacteria bacterium]